MNNAPEKIYIYPESTELEYETIPNAFCDYQEYVRADLVPQWQPIETAPKDGSTVILADKFNQQMAWYCVCGWISQTERKSICFDPTHYMPLPKGPSE